MTKDKAISIARKHLSGIILSGHETAPGTWEVSLKPGKHFVANTKTQEGNISIMNVDFESKEITVSVSDPE